MVQQRNDQGYTLPQFVTVIAILGILMLSGTTLYTLYIRNSQGHEIMQFAHKAKNEVNHHYAKRGSLPMSRHGLALPAVGEDSGNYVDETIMTEGGRIALVVHNLNNEAVEGEAIVLTPTENINELDWACEITVEALQDYVPDNCHGLIGFGNIGTSASDERITPNAPLGSGGGSFTISRSSVPTPIITTPHPNPIVAASQTPTNNVIALVDPRPTKRAPVDKIPENPKKPKKPKIPNPPKTPVLPEEPETKPPKGGIKTPEQEPPVVIEVPQPEQPALPPEGTLSPYEQCMALNDETTAFHSRKHWIHTGTPKGGSFGAFKCMNYGEAITDNYLVDHVVENLKNTCGSGLDIYGAFYIQTENPTTDEIEITPQWFACEEASYTDSF